MWPDNPKMIAASQTKKTVVCEVSMFNVFYTYTALLHNKMHKRHAIATVSSLKMFAIS